MGLDLVLLWFLAGAKEWIPADSKATLILQGTCDTALITIMFCQLSK